MKRSELFFSFIQLPLDFVMIILATTTAWSLRHSSQVQDLISNHAIFKFSFNQYIRVVIVLAFVMLVFYALERLYDIRVTRKFLHETFSVFKATTIVLVLITIGFFLQREWFSSRFIIFSGWGLIIFYVVIARYIMHKIQKWLLVHRGIGRHRVLLVGGNGKSEAMRKTIQMNPHLGYVVVGHTGTASITRIKEIKQRYGVDEIIVCEPSIPDDELEKLVDYCEINGIIYKYIPTSMQTTRFSMQIFKGEPLIQVHSTPLEGWGRILKQIFDSVGSFLLIIIFAPLMLLIAILIKVTDPRGPIIFCNERIGGEGKKISVYKFRYMKWEYSTAKENPKWREALAYEQKLIKERSLRHGPLYKIKNDPRKTRVGSFVERYSIDELPQLFNVLKGEMSLVGPRPHQEREVEKYHEYHRRLLTIKPGMTGMAQVSGRSDLDFEDEYKLDVYYIENWSLWMDVAIMLKTISVLFRRRRNN